MTWAIVAPIGCGQAEHEITGESTVDAAVDGAGREPMQTCPDRDGDGMPSATCGGADCDDSDPDVTGVDTNGTIGDFNATVAVPGEVLLYGDTRDPIDLALDDSGVAHVVVQGHYASNPGGAWVVEPLPDSPESWGGRPAIAVSGDSAHVAFVVAGMLGYARKQGGRWSREWLFEAVGAGTSMALDSAGRPSIAYFTSEGLRLAVQEDRQWLTSALSAAVDTAQLTAGVALVSDDAGRLHIAYLECTTDQCLVQYGAGTGDVWSTETVATTGRSSVVSLAVTRGGDPHVAYNALATGEGGIHYATRREGRWIVNSIGEAAAWSVEIGLGPSSVHVVGQVSGIFYTTLVDGRPAEDARSTTPETGSSCDCWGGTAVAVAPDGSAHVAFTGFNFSDGTHAYYATDQHVAPDGIDGNCDGVDGLDGDGDGFASIPSGGTDCDDANPSVSSADSAGCASM